MGENLPWQPPPFINFFHITILDCQEFENFKKCEIPLLMNQERGGNAQLKIS